MEEQRLKIWEVKEKVDKVRRYNRYLIGITESNNRDR